MAQTGSRNDPFGNFNFLVTIDGVTVAGFSECSGLTTETNIVEYRTGDEDITVRKLPGLKKFNNISLKRGFTNSKDLWEWRKKVLDGKTERQSGSIVLLNEARQPSIRWNFREGWPSKWEGPTFNAKNNEVAIETMEIAHEGLELE
ncbi:MAG: phage tail protein [Deltaproteobacteria bacterium]|nr:phage tail protein [Deltaproteobacteria bacterium]